jgi:hypothetical protein
LKRFPPAAWAVLACLLASCGGGQVRIDNQKPSSLPMSWAEFENNLRAGERKFLPTTMGFGNFQPGSMVKTSSVMVDAFSQGQLEASVGKVRYPFPAAVEKQGFEADLHSVEASGISFSLDDLRKVVGLHAGTSFLQGAHLKFNKIRWRSVEDLPAKQWLSDHENDFKSVYREAIENGDLHMVTAVLEADVEIRFVQFSSAQAGGYLKKVFSASAFDVDLASGVVSTKGRLIPLAARTVPMTDLLSWAKPREAPFQLLPAEIADLAKTEEVVSRNQLWNSAHEVSYTVSYLVERSSVTMVMEIVGNLAPGAVNPGRIVTGENVDVQRRYFVNGAEVQPEPLVDAPGATVKAGGVSVGDSFRYMTVARVPRECTPEMKGWDRYAVPVTFEKVKSVTVQVYLLDAPMQDARLAATRSARNYRLDELKLKSRRAATAGDLASLGDTLEQPLGRSRLVRKLQDARAGRNLGWVMTPAAAKMLDQLILIHTCR